MKRSFVIVALLVAIVAMVLFAVREFRRSTPSVTAEILAKLRATSPGSLNASQESSASVKNTSAGNSSPIDAISLSSFLPNSAVSSLSPETCARLEVYLEDARRITYGVLVTSGVSTRLPDGRIHLEIVGESRRANEIKDQIYSSIEAIVGAESMKRIREALGPKFDAKFGYFGEYDTTIDLSIDRTPNANEYVTMISEYRQVKLLGMTSARIRSTSADRKNRFEARFFSLSALNPIRAD